MENERNWSELHRAVCFGEAGGRVLWQPRIGCWYGDKNFAGERLPEPYEGLSREDIFRELDCSMRLYHHCNPCFRRVEHSSVRIESEWLNELDERIDITTPAGSQTAVHRHSPNNAGIIHLKWEVATEAELKVATWREENATWEWDQEQFDRAIREVGDLGAPTAYLPRMNVQCLYIEKMGTQNGIYALHDWPDTVEAFFRAREANHDRLLDLVAASPVDIINFGENVHAGTLPPNLFRKYQLPACRRRCDKLHAAGKFCHSHWDGNCKPLLPYAQDTGLDGIEAITPEPQGDVTLEEVREALGDEMFLIDGIPAVYFDETFETDTLVECVETLIDLFAPRLILGISDEISSTGDIERIRLVGSIVDEYNESLPRKARASQ
jgi:hypothetical protein